VKALLPIYIPANEIPRKELYHIIDDAFQHFSSPEVLPTKLLGDIIIVEMFHGDTGAFKDIAMSIIGRMMDYFLRKRQRQVTVVVGTSGDTGSAAIYGVKDSAQMDIIVYYPKGRISEMQELQMVTHLSSNVHVFACHGTSDDLDVPIKAVLNDTSFSAQHNLCSINSVNWARVCVQIAHFFHASFRALSAYGDLIPVDIYVPTGACGDLVGGMFVINLFLVALPLLIFVGRFAAAMGLPCKLFACVNENDIIHRWLLSGVFSVAPQVVQTVAPSMDIQVPYNVERMLWLASSVRNVAPLIVAMLTVSNSPRSLTKRQRRTS
jgi:threonine synthase